SDLHDSRDYEQAVELARALLEKAEERFGSESLQVARALDALVQARIYARQPRNSVNIAFARRALKIKETILGPEHVEVAKSLIILVKAIGTHEAMPYVERSLAMREKLLGPDHPDVAESLTVMGTLLTGKGDLDGARSRYMQAITLLEAKDPDHPGLVDPLVNLGTLLAMQKDFEGSIPLQERAMVIAEKARVPELRMLAEMSRNLGNLYMVLGDLPTARTYYEHCLVINEQMTKPDTASIIWLLNQLSYLFQKMGQFENARKLAQQSVNLWEQSEPSKHDSPSSLNTLARVSYVLGDYDRAEKLYLRALAFLIERKAHAPWQAQIMTHLGNIYREIDLPDKGRNQLEEALAIRERELRPDHPLIAWTLVDMAILALDSGDPETAQPLLEKARSIYEKNPERNFSQLAVCLSQLAYLARLKGDLAAAKDLYRKAVAEFESAAGPDHPFLAAVMNDLGHTCSVSAEFEQAREYHEKALSIASGTLGAESPDTARSLSALALLYFRAGEHDRALDAALEAEAIARKHQRVLARSRLEKHARQFEDIRLASLDVALSVLSAGIHNKDGLADNEARKIWDTIIRSRSLAGSEATGKDAESIKTPPEAEAYDAACRRLANVFLRGSGDLPPEHYRAVLGQAWKEKEQTARALEKADPQFTRIQIRNPAGYEDVAGALGEGQGLVAFVRYNLHSSKASATQPIRSYIAFSLISGSSKPAIIPLGPAEPIDSLVDRWTKEKKDRRAGKQLRRKIWDPVSKHLAAATQLIVVPAGQLQRVELAGLPGIKKKTKDSNPLKIHCLADERDIAP
ncbi:tetratricopeptide repeat protein, partial [Acidobacteriota bacterium]